MKHLCKVHKTCQLFIMCKARNVGMVCKIIKVRRECKFVRFVICVWFALLLWHVRNVRFLWCVCWV
jgi:hypothetical protein